MQSGAIIKPGWTAVLSAALVVAIPLSWQSACRAGEQGRTAAQGAKRAEEVVVTVVYDNYALKDGMKTAWGFACVVEGLGETILFDTGGEGGVLLANMAKAGFRPEQIGSVVLSHLHSDHTGGLVDFLKANNKVRVFVPEAFPAEFREKVRESGAEVVETEGPCKICDGAWTTGVLKEPLAEQGLCLETPEGPVVVTGCAHPGIARMAEAARRHAKKPVFAVLGGFHMSRAPDDQIDAAIRGLQEGGVRRAGPSHCSGDKTRKAMQEAFGERYVRSGLGARLVFGDEENDASR
ncbi:MAG TPA: MBL fold metallo-hydrolase [Thermoguttaceae bacterium]|nr:MBL fold metallo-hydrolase [Thermoguttaceae bacterium]